LTGKQLAQGICGTCHLFPEPQLLDKNTWTKGVLPHMALRLGFMSFMDNPYARLSVEEIETVVQANVFPHSPIIDSITWAKIVEYYESEAPEKPLPQTDKPLVELGLALFDTSQINISSEKPSLITLLQFDTSSNSLFVGDRRSKLYKLDQQFKPIYSVRLDSPPASMYFAPQNQLEIITIGEMDPNDKKLGKLISIEKLNADSTITLETLLPNLSRPVHVSVADLNKDGFEDKIVCSFGNYTGSLKWYESLGNKKYKEHLVKQIPGARKTIIHDINNDGLADIVCLITQGNEGIFAFINQGKGNFKERQILRFPPVYGSSDFDLVDFNQDGLIDILYTNGDNADFSYSLKKYHGVRLYLNKGDGIFELMWFYPMHGATKALAQDFDKDGDLDIAAIAFFPDYINAPDEGFIYFENYGDLQFKPQTFSNALKGRWLTIEIGDFDDDSDIDIALGSFTLSTTPVPEHYRKSWNNKGTDIIVLHNQLNTPLPLFKRQLYNNVKANK
jgi:hypothetical protein